jgi:ferredoxin
LKKKKEEHARSKKKEEEASEDNSSRARRELPMYIYLAIRENLPQIFLIYHQSGDKNMMASRVSSQVLRKGSCCLRRRKILLHVQASAATLATSSLSSPSSSSSSSSSSRVKNYNTFNHNNWNSSFLFHKRQFSSKTPSIPADIAEYLNSLDIDDESLHKGVLQAMESMYGKGNVKVEHLKSFGEAGMQALAASVDQQNAKLYKKGGKTRPSVSLLVKVPHHATEFEVLWRRGDTLLEVAQQNMDLFGEYMEGTCGGNASCCTCHIYLEQPEIQLALPDPDESELDMLDLAYEPQESSRLGCQVKLNSELMNVCQTIKPEIIIPSGVNNVWN